MQARRQLQQEIDDLALLGAEGVQRLSAARMAGWAGDGGRGGRGGRSGGGGGGAGRLPFEIVLPMEQPETWREFLERWEHEKFVCVAALPLDVPLESPQV